MKFQLQLMLILLLLSLCVMAQKETSRDLLSILSTDQKFVRLAVDSSICLIRQEYTLIDNAGNEYGRRNDPYFGRKYLLGLIADSGIWVGGDPGRPWMDDRNFDKFKHSDSLRPHLTRTLFKRPQQRDLTVIRDSMAGTAVQSPSSPLARPDTLRAIGCAGPVRDGEGWLVLVSSKEDPAINDTLTLTYNTYQPKLSSPDSAGRAYIRNLPEGKYLIGGNYYSCTISLGRIVFAAAGILRKDEKGWYILPLCKSPIH